MDLVEILTRLTTQEGLEIALVAGRDGLLIEGETLSSGIDLEPLAALATRALGEMERLGRAVAGGNVAQVRVRFDSYLLLVELLPSTDVLVAGVQGAGNSERLLDAIARYRFDIQQALSNL